MVADPVSGLCSGTPVEHYSEVDPLLWVKREDLACAPPGPQFSKTRGCYRHIQSRLEKVIGVLDTFHSQAGHAVAFFCQKLGKQCINYYPEYTSDRGLREPQLRSQALGAKLVGLPAGMSAVLFHQAKAQCTKAGGYMMPNALKLNESVEETEKECSGPNSWDWIVIPASSGTIAAGVIKGHPKQSKFIVHLGYSRSHDEVIWYMEQKSGVSSEDYELVLVDEGYAYKDVARQGPTPPWPCNQYYDLKAFRWLMANRAEYSGRVLFWNIG